MNCNYCLCHKLPTSVPFLIKPCQNKVGVQFFDSRCRNQKKQREIKEILAGYELSVYVYFINGLIWIFVDTSVPTTLAGKVKQSVG